MVHMANQIAIYFASYPPREAPIAGVADYLKKYCERRMRRQIMQYVAYGGTGLHEPLPDAVGRLTVGSGRTAA
jgi:hypothetical protein